MAPDQPIESHAKHPVLGPAIAVYDDHAKTKRTLIIEIAMMPLGIMGVLLGYGDLTGGAAPWGLPRSPSASSSRRTGSAASSSTGGD